MINSNQRNDIWLRSQDLDLWWISWTLPVWLSFRFVVSCRWEWQYTKALTNYVKIILHTDCQVPKTITGTKKKQWVQLVVRIVQTPTFQLLWVFSSLVVWQILSVNHLRIIRKTKVNRKTFLVFLTGYWFQSLLFYFICANDVKTNGTSFTICWKFHFILFHSFLKIIRFLRGEHLEVLLIA